MPSLSRGRRHGPQTAYGRWKLFGEKRVAEICRNSAILRTAWVYSPFGSNFLRTRLRINEARDEIDVVADQRGNPTSALDIADDLRGVFHMTGSGEATWADFAERLRLTYGLVLPDWRASLATCCSRLLP